MKHLPENKTIYLVIILVIIAGAFLYLRSDEDTWIKDKNGSWVMHGNPAVKDFDTCAQKYAVRETSPRQCQIPNGPTFSEQ